MQQPATATPGPVAPAVVPPTNTPRVDLGAAYNVDSAKIAARRVENTHAAVASSPFIDATISGLVLEDRYGDPFVFGVQAGAYLGQAVRLVARLEMPSKNATDDYSRYGDDYNSFTRPSADVTLIYGGSLGIVAASSNTFAFSPGLMFLRSDVSDYGNFLGISLPFEWVTSRGLRFGLEAGLGRAFGGTVHYQCSTTVCPGGVPPDADRPAGRAAAIRFEMGFGFNHPR